MCELSEWEWTYGSEKSQRNQKYVTIPNHSAQRRKYAFPRGTDTLYAFNVNVSAHERLIAVISGLDWRREAQGETAKSLGR